MKSGNGYGTKKRGPSADNSSLPLASVIPDRDVMSQAVSLLKEAAKLDVQKKKAEERLDEIKLELHGISEAYAPSGFRFGNIGYQHEGYRTRQTLSREKLVENGVDPAVIGASFVESEPFLYSKFIHFL